MANKTRRQDRRLQTFIQQLSSAENKDSFLSASLNKILYNYDLNGNGTRQEAVDYIFQAISSDSIERFNNVIDLYNQGVQNESEKVETLSDFQERYKDTIDGIYNLTQKYGGQYQKTGKFVDDFISEEFHNYLKNVPRADLQKVLTEVNKKVESDIDLKALISLTKAYAIERDEYLVITDYKKIKTEAEMFLQEFAISPEDREKLTEEEIEKIEKESLKKFRDSVDTFMRLVDEGKMDREQLQALIYEMDKNLNRDFQEVLDEAVKEHNNRHAKEPNLYETRREILYAHQKQLSWKKEPPETVFKRQRRDLHMQIQKVLNERQSERDKDDRGIAKHLLNLAAFNAIAEKIMNTIADAIEYHFSLKDKGHIDNPFYGLINETYKQKGFELVNAVNFNELTKEQARELFIMDVAQIRQFNTMKQEELFASYSQSLSAALSQPNINTQTKSALRQMWTDYESGKMEKEIKEMIKSGPVWDKYSDAIDKAMQKQEEFMQEHQQQQAQKQEQEQTFEEEYENASEYSDYEPNYEDYEYKEESNSGTFYRDGEEYQTQSSTRSSTQASARSYAQETKEEQKEQQENEPPKHNPYAQKYREMVTDPREDILPKPLNEDIEMTATAYNLGVMLLAPSLNIALKEEDKKEAINNILDIYMKGIERGTLYQTASFENSDLYKEYALATAVSELLKTHSFKEVRPIIKEANKRLTGDYDLAQSQMRACSMLSMYARAFETREQHDPSEPVYSNINIDDMKESCGVAISQAVENKKEPEKMQDFYHRLSENFKKDSLQYQLIAEHAQKNGCEITYYAGRKREDAQNKPTISEKQEHKKEQKLKKEEKRITEPPKPTKDPVEMLKMAMNASAAKEAPSEFKKHEEIIDIDMPLSLDEKKSAKEAAKKLLYGHESNTIISNLLEGANEEKAQKIITEIDSQIFKNETGSLELINAIREFNDQSGFSLEAPHCEETIEKMEEMMR